MTKTRNRRNRRNNKKRVRHNRRYTKRGGNWFKNITRFFTRKRGQTIISIAGQSPLESEKLGKRSSSPRIRTPS